VHPKPLLSTALAGVLLLATAATAQDAEKKEANKKDPVAPDAEKAKKKPKPGATTKVEKREFDLLIKATGTLASTKKEAKTVRVELEKWTELKIVEVVPHGSEVKKGDTLIKFDTEGLEKSIADAERALPGKATTLEVAKAELGKLTATEERDLDQAKQTREQAEADYAYYLETGRPLSEKTYRYNLKRAKEYLENSEEELRQLLLMYEADDLTEETEEIIIQRQRDQVASSKFTVERAQIAHDRAFSTTIERAATAEKTKSAMAELDFKVVSVTIPSLRKTKKLEVETAEHALTEAEKALEEKKADLEILQSVKAPADGVVIYGAIEGGKFTTASRMKDKLVKNGKLASGEVSMTIIPPAPTTVHFSLKEADLTHLPADAAGLAKLKGTTGVFTPIKLTSLASTPGLAGGYPAEAKIVGDLPEEIRSGRTADLVFQPIFHEAALTLPVKAVHERFRNGKVEQVVYLKSGATKTIQVGARNAEHVIIEAGLKEGAEVLLAKP